MKNKFMYLGLFPLSILLITSFMRLYTTSTQISDNVKDILDTCVRFSIVAICILTIICVVFAFKSRITK